VFDDIRTPNVDALAASGVRAVHGYSTAPQCVPSRAGLLVGKFQSRFGVEANGRSLDGFNRETTIAQRLQKAGYITAQFGKWHLGPSTEITNHGFKHVYSQNSQGSFAANITLDGKDREMGVARAEMYHVDGCSRAAASLIERYKDQPLFLYVAYRAPHVPLDAPPKYLNRFPGKMAERRRQALAMLSAVDDGVGLVMQTLKENGLSEKTLVFYIGDNGAPLKIHKADAPGGGPGWDGSLNDPLNGEKGMLSEGGMHTPFVVAWPGKIPGGQQYLHPITALDVAATASAIAGIDVPAKDLDGVNLLPYLSGENNAAPHEALMWRWTAQSAIRVGKWKLLRAGDREYLFDLDADLEEKNNLAARHPEIAERLRTRLREWSEELSPPGLAAGPVSAAAKSYFDFYLDGKQPAPLRAKFVPSSEAAVSTSGDLPWQIRGGRLIRSSEGFAITADAATKRGALMFTRNGINLAGPVAVGLTLKTAEKGTVAFAWRTARDRTFVPENRVSVALDPTAGWQTVQASLPTGEKIVHMRVQLPPGVTSIKSLELTPARGKAVTLTE
jgi:uncharacterized sulfatase